MRTTAILLCLLLSGAARAAEPATRPVDAPMALNAVELRVGDAVPFDGVLTEESEYVKQGKAVKALVVENGELRARPSLLVIVVGAVVLVGGGVALGYGLSKVTR